VSFVRFSASFTDGTITMVPLSEFTGLTTKAHIAQLVLSGAPAGTVYIDNVYFSKVVVMLFG
jgi:hypothetical protein